MAKQTKKTPKNQKSTTTRRKILVGLSLPPVLKRVACYRFAPLLIVALVIGVVGAWKLATSSAATPADTFSIASYNTRFDTPKAKTVADVQKLIDDKSADIIALQEMGNDTRAQAVLDEFACGTCAFDAYAPRAEGKNEMITLWRKTQFSLVEADSLEATQKTNIGTLEFRSLYVQSVKLAFVQSPTKKHVVILNNHLPAHVDSDDDGVPDEPNGKRQELYDKNIARIQQKVNASLPPNSVVVVGDFNVSFRVDSKKVNPHFPYKAMKDVGGRTNWDLTGYNTSNPQKGTIQSTNRLIDNIFLVKKSNVAKVNSTSILDQGMNSDHNASVASITIQ